LGKKNIHLELSEIAQLAKKSANLVTLLEKHSG
jgi:hypothetical protein